MKPPSAFRLLAYGPQAATEPREDIDGWVFTREDAERLVAAAGGRPIAIDWHHQMMGRAPRADGLRPAAGWIGRLEVRGDGLWAAGVEWTPKAAQAIRDGEHRYFSPVVFWADKAGGRAARLGPVALTNQPALRDALLTAASADRDSPLAIGCHAAVSQMLIDLRTTACEADDPARGASTLDASGAGGKTPGQATGAGGASSSATRGRGRGDKETAMDFRAKVAEALGLGADATDEAILAALTERLGAGSGFERRLSGLAAKLQLAVAADADDGAVVTALEQHLAGAAEREALREGRIAVLERRAADAEFDLLVSSGAGKGKVAPSMREPMRTLFHSDRAKFDALVKTLPVLASDRSELETAGGGAAEGAEDPYLARLDEVRSERGCTRIEAIRIVGREQPALLEAYRERQRAPR